jgi:protein-tyrosine phosphatase
MNILFVCTGNTCRSPLAEAAWRALPDDLRSQATVGSAGIRAATGEPAAAHGVAIARNWQVDMQGHRSRRLTLQMVEAADLICTMSVDAAQWLKAEYPGCGATICSLGEFSTNDRSYDIEDPYGGSPTDYEQAASHIRDSVTCLAQSLKNGAIKVQARP